MTMHSEDWARLWAPLATELLKAAVKLIFGNKATKSEVYRQYADAAKQDTFNV